MTLMCLDCAQASYTHFQARRADWLRVCAIEEAYDELEEYDDWLVNEPCRTPSPYSEKSEKPWGSYESLWPYPDGE